MIYSQQTMDLGNTLEDAALGTRVTNFAEDVGEGIPAFHEQRSPRFRAA